MSKEIFRKSFFCRLIIIFFVAFICFAMNNNIYADTIRPLAIMIGNSPEEIANQTGLGNADIIYEVNVEFPFTRLMAIFINNDSSVVGPVRSSRYYFSRLAAEWSPVFAHCGGQSLKNEKTVNLDQMHYSSPYWRNEKIGGWVDLFTNTKNLREKCRKLNFKDRVILNNSLLSKRNLDLSGGSISKIFIKYNQKYSISYKYDSDSNTYL